MTAQQDFLPTATWANLRMRSGLLRKTREFFYAREFIEVDTPVLSADTVIDRHLDPLPVVVFNDPRRPDVGDRMWLQTSPEFHMKRLMASGGEAIFQITHAMRAGESGPLHNPEFTIVEWYRSRDSMYEGMQLLADLADALLGCGPAEVLTYGQAFRIHVGVDPHRDPVEALREAAQRHGIPSPGTLTLDDRDGWLNFLLVALVQPHLGAPHPVIVCDFPATQAALSQIRAGDPPVAERFELFVRGIELANGYHELLDASVLAARNRRANAERKADGKCELPEQSRLLEAMHHGLPDCTGVALGFDRLVMLAAGADHLAKVLPFPIDRA